MANLPDVFHESTGPAREDINLFVGSVGGARWDVFQLKDQDGAQVDLTGIAISAELRTLDDQLLAILPAEITDAAGGWCRVAASATLVASLPGVSWKRSGTDPRVRIGRYAVFLSDETDRWCIKAGDVYGVRA
jgi:hypothetical protein